MSIILDALKKAQKETAVSDGTQTAFVPPSSPATAQRSVMQKKFFDRRKGIVVILGVVAVLGLAWVLFAPEFLNRMRSQSTANLAKDLPQQVPATTVAPLAVTAGSTEAVAVKKADVKTTAADKTSQADVTKNQAALTDDTLQEQEDPNREEVLRLQALAAKNYSEANYEESATHYEKLTTLTPLNAEVYNNYGVVLRKLGKLDKAREVYRKALALNSEYTQAMNNLAVVEMNDNHYDIAKDLLQRTVALDPQYMDAYLHLGVCLEKNGENTAAQDAYKKFLKLSEKKVDRRIRLQVEDRLARLKEK